MALLAAFSYGFCSESKVPYPFPQKSESTEGIQRAKARKLFEYARRENEKLRWDECLAGKAFRRAKQMIEKGYFSHEDPKTGRNSAWDLVASCYRCRYAAENLTKGYQSAEDTHESLMESETHRRNLLNSRYRLMGVGCYDYICVQLFAGF